MTALILTLLVLTLAVATVILSVRLRAAVAALSAEVRSRRAAEDALAERDRAEHNALVATATDGRALARSQARELELTRLNADLDAVARATAQVLAGDDARQAVVDAAQSVTGAVVATLLEPSISDGRERLVTSAHAGADLGVFSMPLDQPSRVAQAYRTGRLQLVTDIHTDPDVNQLALERMEAALDGEELVRSMVAIPVGGDDEVRAVLSLGLSTPLATSDLRLLGLLELLAANAALAINREDSALELARLATTDALTGVGNRRRWDEDLAAATSRAAETGVSVTVAVLDLDHFKALNDTFGHHAGDELLVNAARSWSSILRDGDSLARLGGEEFGVLLVGCSDLDASHIIERLRAEVPDGQTCSAGVARWEGEPLDEFMSRADQALYAAKRGGRNRQCEAPAALGPVTLAKEASASALAGNPS